MHAQGASLIRRAEFVQRAATIPGLHCCVSLMVPPFVTPGSPPPAPPRPALSPILQATPSAVRAVDPGRSLTDALAPVPAPPRPAVQAVSVPAMPPPGRAAAAGHRV